MCHRYAYMPPTLVVEDGTGKSNSNSYVTAAEIDAYMEHIPAAYLTTFATAGIFIKEQLAIWATQILEGGIIWPEHTYRLVPGQRLHFPCYGLLDQDGVYYINEHTIPYFVKDATCQLVFELFKTDLTLEPPRGLQSLRVGPIQIDFDTNHAHDVKLIPRSVMLLLWPWGCYLRGSARIKTMALYRS